MEFSKHFIIKELVPKSTYNTFGENSKWFIKPELVKLMDFTREWFRAPIIINNWHVGGTFQYRGFRPITYSGGGTYSQHRQGNAVDFNIKGLTPQQVYEEVLNYEYAFMFAGLTTMEDIDYTPTWNHFDLRYTGLDNILIVKP